MKRALGNYLIMGFVFLFTFAFIARFAFIDTSTLEDSIWVRPALDIMQGKVIFRETFSGYGMLVPLLQAATMKLFGTYSLVLRLEAALFYALSITLLFLTWTKFVNLKSALSSVLLWLILMPFYTYILLPWSSVFALDFQAAAFLLLILSQTDKNRWFAFLAGAATTLAFLSRQPVGIFMGMAVTAYYLVVLGLKKKNKLAEAIDLAAYCIGAVACFLPFFMYLVFNHALKDWWIQSFLFARQFAITLRGLSFDQVIKSLFMLRFIKDGTYLQKIIWLLIPLSSIYLLIKAFFEYKKDQLSQHMRFYMLAGLISASSWLQYYPEVGPSHFFWADTPIIGFFIYTVTDIVSIHSKSVAKLFSNYLFLPLVIILVLLGGIYQARTRSYTALSSVPSLRSIRLTSFDNDSINDFSARLKQNLGPSDQYVNLSDDALVTLLDNRFHSIEPLYMQRDFITTKVYPDYYQKALTEIRNRRPVLVSRTLPYIEGYCSLAHISYPQPLMQIHIPAERILHTSFENDVLSITAKRDLELVSVNRLQTPILAFTVPDTGKLNIVPAADQAALPLFLTKGERYTLDLIHSDKPLILSFNDKDIQSCTLAVMHSSR